MIFIIALLACTLCASTSAVKSFGVVGMHYHSKTHKKDVHQLIDKTVNLGNILIFALRKNVTDEINRKIEAIHNIKFEESEIATGIVHKITHNIKTMEPSKTKYIKFSHKNFGIKSPSTDIGILLDFASEGTVQLGTHCFLTNTPGADLYLALQNSNFRLAIGVGPEVVIYKLKYDQEKITLPFTAVYGIAKLDWKMNEKTQIYAMYKISHRPLIESAHAVGIGISQAF